MGTSLLTSHRTVREPIDSYGSYHVVKMLGQMITLAPMVKHIGESDGYLS